MKRVIKAIAEEIQERITPDILAAIFTQFAIDVLEGDSFEDDTPIGLGMTVAGLREIGAMWRQPYAWEHCTAAVGTRFVHLKFSEVIDAAAEDTDDLLTIVNTVAAIVKEASAKAAVILEGLRPNQKYDEAVAKAVAADGMEALRQLVEMAQQATDQSDVEEEINSAMVYQFPTPSTLQ